MRIKHSINTHNTHSTHADKHTYMYVCTCTAHVIAEPIVQLHVNSPADKIDQ